MKHYDKTDSRFELAVLNYLLGANVEPDLPWNKKKNGLIQKNREGEGEEEGEEGEGEEKCRGSRVRVPGCSP